MKKRIIVLMLVLEISMMSVLIYLLYSQKETITITEKSFEFVFTLISIAISTWIGLNIYNIVEKSEFDNLKKEVAKKKEEYEDTVDILTKQLISASNELKKMQIQQKEITENILEERKSLFENHLNINNTWYVPFKTLCHDKINKTNFEILGYLIQVEKMYFEAYKADEQDDIIESIKLCKEGLYIIDICKNLFDNNTFETSKSNPWFSFYLQIRESDFYYFIGNYYRLCKQDYKKAKENYIKELDILIHIDYLIRNNELDINDPYCLAKHYNTIATSYIFLMDFKDQQYEEYSVMAYKYSQLSIKTNHANAKAYRNFGVISERRGLLKQAEEAYQNSISKNPREYKSYLCMASLFLKNITKKLIIENKGSYMFKEFGKLEKENIKVKLKEINIILNTGISYASIPNDFHNKLGWCYSYLYLLEDNPTQAKSYFNESEKQLKIANQLNPNLASKNLDRLYKIKEFKATNEIVH